MIFGRIELILSVSKAKFDAEADFEVHRPPNPQNPNDKRNKLFFRSENFRQFFFSRRRKMKRWELSETRFPKFSWRTEVISSAGRCRFDPEQKYITRNDNKNMESTSYG